MIIRLSTGASVEFTQCDDRWHWEYWQAGRVPCPFMGSKDGEGFPSLDGALHPWERVNAIEDTQVGPLGYRIVWRDRNGARHVEQYRRENV